MSILLQHAAGTHFTSHTHFEGEVVINAEEGCTLALMPCKNAVQKILPIVLAAAGARACACPSNGIWRICDFDFWHDKSIRNHGFM